MINQQIYLHTIKEDFGQTEMQDTELVILSR